MALRSWRGWLLLLTFAMAVSVFAVVQDRVTAAGARRYVAMQRERIAAGEPPVAVEDIMRPAIERSVRQGALWGGVVLAAGLGLAVLPRRSGRRA